MFDRTKFILGGSSIVPRCIFSLEWMEEDGSSRLLYIYVLIGMEGRVLLIVTVYSSHWNGWRRRVGLLACCMYMFSLEWMNG